MDVVGMLGEISGFWLVVPLLFGLLFYRRNSGGNDEEVELRDFKICGQRKLAERTGPRSRRATPDGILSRGQDRAVAF